MTLIRTVARLRACDRCGKHRGSVKRRQTTIHYLCATCWAKKKARRRARERAIAKGTS